MPRHLLVVAALTVVATAVVTASVATVSATVASDSIHTAVDRPDQPDGPPVRDPIPEIDGPVDDARWRVPVSASIVDFFRPPSHPFGPGNRGLEFAVESGAVVSAVDDGIVSFAGQVGADFHVVVDHSDGLRSGYSHLELTSVESGELDVGDPVARGQEIGRTSARFHLSARLAPGWPDAGFEPWGRRRYVDPLPLLGLEVHVRLTST